MLECALSGGMVEIHNVDVGFVDDFVDSVQSLKLVDDLAVLRHFSFLTCGLEVFRQVGRLRAAAVRFFHEEVE